MSCFVLNTESFERLYHSLVLAHGYLRAPEEGWYRLVWEASAANAAAYDHRYSHHAGDSDSDIGEPHPLKERYKTFPAFKEAMINTKTRLSAPHQHPVALIKLLDCLVYQIIDAREGTKHYRMADKLKELANRIAGHVVSSLPEYEQAPWG